MKISRPGEIEIMGRTYPTRKVLFWLFFGPFLVWLLWALFLVRVIAVLVGWIGKWDLLQVNDTFTSLGQTGDIFGGVNALFAAYAFVGVAIAAFFQQRTFLVIEEQQRQQAFEPLFFKLLELNHDLRPKKLPGNTAQEIDAMGATLGNFGAAVQSFATMILEAVEVGEQVEASSSEIISYIEKKYGLFYRQDETTLGPYFRTLYHVFKLIDLSGLPKDRRIEYANIARASMNRDELALLLFNCVTSQGLEFKPLVESYGLLKHLPVMPRNLRRLARRLYVETCVMNAAEREQYWIENPSSRPKNML